MVEVRCNIGAGDYWLALYGHATGSKEVCAAVSGVVYALAGWLKNFSEYQYKPPVIRLESGASELHAWGEPCTGTAFQMAQIGLAQIEKAYPEYLRMKII